MSDINTELSDEGHEFAERARSAEAKEAFSAFLEMCQPNFPHTATGAGAK